MTRHPGSRLVDHAPDLIRAVQRIRADLARLAGQGRLETLTFTTSGTSTGVAATSGTLANTHVTMVYRSGKTLYADLAAGTGAASVVGAALAVPDFSLVSAEVDTAAGGTEQDFRVSLDFPDGWGFGDPHLVFIQARRVSGADATTMRVLRAWQL